MSTVSRKVTSEEPCQHCGYNTIHQLRKHYCCPLCQLMRHQVISPFFDNWLVHEKGVLIIEIGNIAFDIQQKTQQLKEKGLLPGFELLDNCRNLGLQYVAKVARYKKVLVALEDVPENKKSGN